MSFKEHLIQNIHKKEHDHAHNKIGIVAVHIVCAICILKKDLADDAFVDILEDKLKVEILDLHKGSLFFRISKTLSVKDDSVMAHSKLIIITASASSKEENVKVFYLVQHNILKCIIFTLSNCLPDCKLLVASNPVDILTYAVWKMSCFPKHHVIDSASIWTSAHFCYLMGERLGIHSLGGSQVNGEILVYLFGMGVNIASVSLKVLHPDRGAEVLKQNWKEIHKQVVDSAYEVIRMMEYGSN